MAQYAVQVGILLLVIVPLLLIIGTSISMGIGAVCACFVVLGPGKVAVTAA